VRIWWLEISCCVVWRSESGQTVIVGARHWNEGAGENASTHGEGSTGTGSWSMLSL